MKIDGEFVRNLPASSTDQLIIDSIVQMSKGLGKRTITEFVGDRETAAVLKERGVDYGQGFHLGRPVPVAEALAAFIRGTWPSRLSFATAPRHPAPRRHANQA